MSHTLFSKAPALRTAARRIASQPLRTSAYHSASGPKMPSGAAPIRTLLRQTTLRATAIAARTSFPATHQFTTTTTSQQPYYTHQRSRSPSPPPPYSTRNTSLLASPNSWTRFHSSSSNTLSAVRTFSSASKPTVRFASTSSAVGSSLSPERAELVEEAIEQITELYGIAKDEFELAHEETEKNTTYAADDRAAARAELDTLIEYYEDVVSGGANAGGDKEVGEEVRRRVGGRSRELVKAVEAMEEAVTHGD